MGEVRELIDEAVRRRRAAERDIGRFASMMSVVIGERDRLAERITHAIAALDTAPDVDPAKATRAEVAATHAANLKAWTILTEGRDPPSRRGGGAGETAFGAINSAGVSDV